MVKKAYKKYSIPFNNHLSLLQETWDKAYQDGYAKGRVRCLEQHRGEELKEAIAKDREELERKIEEWLGDDYGNGTCADCRDIALIKITSILKNQVKH